MQVVVCREKCAGCSIQHSVLSLFHTLFQIFHPFHSLCNLLEKLCVFNYISIFDKMISLERDFLKFSCLYLWYTWSISIISSLLLLISLYLKCIHQSKTLCFNYETDHLAHYLPIEWLDSRLSQIFYLLEKCTAGIQ